MVRSDGARMLERKLTKRGETLASFCRSTGVNYWLARRAMLGEVQQISVDLALDLAEAARIPVRTWREETRKAG